MHLLSRVLPDLSRRVADDNFSLRLGFADVPRLHTLLEAVSAEQHEALRRGVRIHAGAFSWEAHGTAYEHLRYSLCLRAARAERTQIQACYHMRPQTLPRTKITRGGVHGYIGL